MSSFARRERALRAVAVVGVDAGKFHHVLVVRPRGRPDSKPFSFTTNRPGFENAVAYIREQVGLTSPVGEILVGIEFAGSYGFTFAHYLHGLNAGFGVVTVLPAHTKRWKEVTHRQPLKTDAKDAIGIADLTAHGHFVAFPFLATPYAELRYLLSARERVSTLRRGAITRLRAVLDVVFPEFAQFFDDLSKRTARTLLRTYPGPTLLCAAPARAVVLLLKTESRNHLGRAFYDELIEAAKHTVALPAAQGAMRDEIPLLIDRLNLYAAQLRTLEARIRLRLGGLPAARALVTIPNVAPVTAAVLLGSIGDPKAYDSSRQVLAIAGLSLVERSSGILQGMKRISKRGRPALRKHAYMFAIRSVHQGGIFRKDYDALLSRNGNKKIPALMAIARKGLKLLFAVAKAERPWTPERPGAHRADVTCAAAGTGVPTESR
jgi:transposase